MNAGGYRVSPIEVEEAMRHYPPIQEVAAAALTIKKDVRVIAAFYVAPDLLNDNHLNNFLAERLARYKIPRLFIRVDQIPRGPNNKIQRQQLRRTWEAKHGQA